MMRGQLAGQAILVAAACCGVAAAQSNSLFRQGRSGATPTGHATTQPARRMEPVISAAPPGRTVRNGKGDPLASAVNPALAQASVIAVRTPEPEQFEVNGLVTIIIREIKSSKTDAKMKAEKDWEVKSTLAKWFRLSEDHKLVPAALENGEPSIDFNFEHTYDTKGQVDREDSFTARITTKIVDVKPNGTLALEGSNRVTLDEEEYIITLTGTCRGQDVTAQNTVLSSQVYGLQLDVQHSGAARDATRRGWLARFFDLLRPI